MTTRKFETIHPDDERLKSGELGRPVGPVVYDEATYLKPEDWQKIVTLSKQQKVILNVFAEWRSKEIARMNEVFDPLEGVQAETRPQDQSKNNP